MNVEEAIALVEKQGVVTESAPTQVLNMAEMIVNVKIEGSWWAHPESHKIFQITRALRASPDIHTCRLVNGKITFIHRRIWPLLVKLKDDFEPTQLAHVKEIHLSSGKHVKHEIPFMEWVHKDIIKEAQKLDKNEARKKLYAILHRK